MEKAFVLINCSSEKVNKVLRKVKKIENVKEAYSIVGTYDIITFVEAVNMSTLEDVLIGKIREIDEVMGTSTAMVVSEWARDQQ